MINIPLRVKNLVKRHDTANPTKIAQELGFTIYPAELPASINGMWRRVLKRKYIVVNENLNEWQINAVIAHELGHYACHRGYKYFSISGRTYYACQRKEKEANEYAIALMSYASDVDSQYIKDFLENAWKINKIFK